MLTFMFANLLIDELRFSASYYILGDFYGFCILWLDGNSILFVVLEFMNG